jgi:hypothetical protein
LIRLARFDRPDAHVVELDALKGLPHELSPLTFGQTSFAVSAHCSLEKRSSSSLGSPIKVI